MKVVMYMAISMNGMIATDRDDTPWSKKEFKTFYNYAKKAGNIAIGRKTYDLMKESGDFSNLKSISVSVLSKKNIQNSKTKFFNSPKKIIENSKKQGFKKIVVCGGTKTNSSFLKLNLMDELIIDVEPLIIGRGINIVTDLEKIVKLKLLGTRKISKDEIQLHYKILK